MNKMRRLQRMIEPKKRAMQRKAMEIKAFTWTVSAGEAQTRLDVFVADKTEYTRSRVQRLIENGAVTVNGSVRRANYAVRTEDGIMLDVPQTVPQTKAQPEQMDLDIVYDDVDICVVNKPQGMVVHPAPGHDSGTLVNGLLFQMQNLSAIGGEFRPGIVHRIDKMTSGLLVVAKNDKAHLCLSEQFRAHTAFRSYLAIVDGNLRDDRGTVDAPIGRHATDRKKMAVVANGRNAVTHWKVLQRFGNYTLLALRLVTGRTHQIRVHMAYIKHPITGDATYGRPKCALPLDGQALHGYRLQLTHPTSGMQMVFYAPLPDYFQKALGSLGWHGDIMNLLKESEGTEE